MTKIRTGYTCPNINESFVNAINYIAKDSKRCAKDSKRCAKESNQSTICAFVGLCGELFPLIEIKYLTQDICTEAMSPLAKWSPDQDSLIKLIPEQFPRKPCRLWRNQFT
jgi:hypothetical protein